MLIMMINSEGQHGLGTLALKVMLAPNIEHINIWFFGDTMVCKPGRSVLLRSFLALYSTTTEQIFGTRGNFSVLKRTVLPIPTCYT